MQAEAPCVGRDLSGARFFATLPSLTLRSILSPARHWGDN